MKSRLFGPEVMAHLDRERGELEAICLDFAGSSESLVARMSHLLLAQFAAAIPHNIFNPWPVLDELVHLEDPTRPTRTRPATPFKRDPLKGLHHKHYFEARHLLGNMDAVYGLSRGGNRKLEDAFQDAFDRAQTVEELASLTGEALVNAPLETRSAKGKLSGEWIVYFAGDHQNAYLSLGAHEDDQEELLQAILDHCEPRLLAGFLAFRGGAKTDE